MEHISAVLSTITANMGGQFITSVTGSFITVPALEIVTRVKGGPVILSLLSDLSATGSYFAFGYTGGAGGSASISFHRDGALLATYSFGFNPAVTGTNYDVQEQPSTFSFVDKPGLGQYTYGVKLQLGVGRFVAVNNTRLSVISL